MVPARSLALLQVLVVGSACLGTPAHAGPFSDDLAKCLVSSTTVDDRTSLVRWFFAAASVHPAVEPLTAVTQKQLDASNKTVAELFTRLLTDACLAEARSALKFEGPSTFETSFQILGEVAGKEMFSHPAVNTAVMGMTAYLDDNTLKTALELAE